MLRGLTSIFRSYKQLPVSQRPVYEAEREENFRWVSRLFALPAQYPLNSSDRVKVSLQNELADIGQFAEIAHGSIDPEFVWKHMTQLCESNYPLHRYFAVWESILVSVFHGTVANLQGYIAYRPEMRQLVVAFSGTSSLAQAAQALNARMVPYPRGTGAYVHAGFWNMYTGIQKDAISKLEQALKDFDVREIVVTGHSMGAVISSLFCLDILEERISQYDAKSSRQIKAVAFGAPRVGNLALAQLWGELTHHFRVVEYSIRNYNDGVPTMPPYSIGYRHLSHNPLYLAYGLLWRISPNQSEHSLFSLEPEAIQGAQNPYPLGGHNYYNGRDIELLQRRMKWFQPHVEGETWDTLKRRFEDMLAQELQREISLSPS